jgi:type II secretory pathway predicted ATPase ExeA
VAVKYTLQGFDENMTKEYIKHRLKIAGCEEEIFESDAVTAIHHYTRGIPRLINTVCDNTIFEGFLIKQKPLSKDIVDQVANNLNLKPA